MTARDFFELVAAMREQQRILFKSRGQNRTALSASRELEKQVDLEIARVRLIQKEKRNPRLDL